MNYFCVECGKKLETVMNSNMILGAFITTNLESYICEDCILELYEPYDIAEERLSVGL